MIRLYSLNIFVLILLKIADFVYYDVSIRIAPQKQPLKSKSSNYLAVPKFVNVITAFSHVTKPQKCGRHFSA